MRPWIPELPSRDYVDLSPGLLGDQNKCILLLLGIIWTTFAFWLYFWGGYKWLAEVPVLHPEVLGHSLLGRRSLILLITFLPPTIPIELQGTLRFPRTSQIPENGWAVQWYLIYQNMLIFIINISIIWNKQAAYKWAHTLFQREI